MTNLAQRRSPSWQRSLGAASIALMLLAVLGRVFVMTPSAEAQADATFTVLYSFKGGTDGEGPQAGLLRDAAGNLYGTTAYGAVASYCGFDGCGTVFKLDTTGKETVLYTFTGPPDGRGPLAGLVRDAGGNLYGTTAYGGDRELGTVFKIDPSGTETVLHTFIGPPDGRYPLAGLVGDGAGHLYGTTQYGGANDETGTVFKLNLTGKGNLLHSFKDRADGQFPYAGLVRDAAGNLYGTTDGGGAHYGGTVFKIDTAGNETVFYSFAGFPDGFSPRAGLIRDAAGNLYGTTSKGGAFGSGTVFKLDTTGSETVLYSFTGPPDGWNPLAGLIRDTAGNLYGTTYSGGRSNNCVGGCGTVFKLDTAGKLTILHNFTGGPTDGQLPYAGLVRDQAGNFYGTTSGGGAFGFGTVFKLSP